VNEPSPATAITSDAPGTEAPRPGTGQDFPVPPALSPEKTLNAAQWGMVAFLVSEAAFFCTLIAVYIAFIGQDVARGERLGLSAEQIGPVPGKALSLGLVVFTTVCLLSSSGTIHFAEKALRGNNRSGFAGWWALTIVLGVVFLAGTGYEWYELIRHHHLTISRNLFGTTFYTLVGFHGLHVSAGIVALLVMLGVVLRHPGAEASHGSETHPGQGLAAGHHTGVEMVSWYWHFVDGVWVAVFTVVYLVGR
jgi:cytochrome c oxidase subunit 3/cytochrome o ubiquinol oxidase subunit 3